MPHPHFTSDSHRPPPKDAAKHGVKAKSGRSIQDCAQSSCDCAKPSNNAAHWRILLPETWFSPQPAHNLKHQSHSFAQAHALYAGSRIVSMLSRPVPRTVSREPELGYVHVHSERWNSGLWPNQTALRGVDTLLDGARRFTDNSRAQLVPVDGDDGRPRG